ncbi:2-oxo-4-hydroxy-4-carboxy-5-ureidoimidazoline decarboxylase [Pseudonocardia abyssalis]|uniref:2-oxo-4-hydroxy-4-carboxy-5-ureidoimidazoline decarboxylase n=1 Tax=Pseudonocardia abyssalis TaxID=2792008 RepID=A0ABS6V0I3_9PSEU|nr:2-oxo-4-hydroxy-4-carboxy-5-ureidoimidazoline decarboxylase [Pseudonocardia abyssalis]MBW0118095.1 2-oxo-4-hydroxy-4-carboxy-5-ureidoimidazoline decarboxylase [Pseudonocardia abyssalis]MBW0137474.1 2-oxo-4-hydroxy-4-carboxy-5-ureidoimidazoline decarboxylase [Pseudonocardia abyssalis]
MRLDTFNALPASEATTHLTACCASPEWAGALAAGRPYPSVEALLAQADAELAVLDEPEVDLALAGHPRIGERSAHAASQREQAGVAAADAAVLAGLADGNRAYEERFGYVYLVCADGRPAADLLAVLHERLAHDPPAERRVVRAELAKINDIRLRRLLE